MKVDAFRARCRTGAVPRRSRLHPIGEAFPLSEARGGRPQRLNGVLSMTRKYWQSPLPRLRNSCVVVAWK